MTDDLLKMEQNKRRLEESQDGLMEEIAKLRAQGLDPVPLPGCFLIGTHVSLMLGQIMNFILEEHLRPGYCVRVRPQVRCTS